MNNSVIKVSKNSVASVATILSCIALVISLLFILIYKLVTGYYRVRDYADIMSARPFKRFKVLSYSEIQDILARYPDKQISIAGGKFSHGGHTFKEDAIYLDMTNLNKIVNFDYSNKRITAQSGVSWKQLIEFLDPYNLSIKAMQSYANFTLGGSISVNAHGRDIEYSTVGSSVESMKVLCSDNQIYMVYPRDKLFKGVLGGYGGIAIILEATISLTDNYVMERIVKEECIEESTYYKTLINLKDKKSIDDEQIILYNGLIYPQRYII